jgi:hypothetical protein
MPEIEVGIPEALRTVIEAVEAGTQVKTPEGDLVAYMVPVETWRRLRAILQGVADAGVP